MYAALATEEGAGQCAGGTDGVLRLVGIMAGALWACVCWVCRCLFGSGVVERCGRIAGLGRLRRRVGTLFEGDGEGVTRGGTKGKALLGCGRRCACVCVENQVFA